MPNEFYVGWHRPVTLCDLEKSKHEIIEAVLKAFSQPGELQKLADELQAAKDRLKAALETTNQ